MSGRSRPRRREPFFVAARFSLRFLRAYALRDAPAADNLVLAPRVRLSLSMRGRR